MSSHVIIIMIHYKKNMSIVAHTRIEEAELALNQKWTLLVNRQNLTRLMLKPKLIISVQEKIG